MTIQDRIQTTLANIEFQHGNAFWDDIEKLEHCVELLKTKNIKDEFEFVELKSL
jgi:hypothetical protein